MARLGRRLRVLREASNLSQVDLSKETGVSQNYISSLEMGKTASPSMEILCILGKRLGMTPNDIALVAGWWTAPRRDGKLPSDVEWSIDRLQELPKGERAMVSGVLRQMVSAAYRESHGHAPPPPEEATT